MNGFDIAVGTIPSNVSHKSSIARIIFQVTCDYFGRWAVYTRQSSL